MRIDEVENGIVSGYEVAAGNRADQQQWAPALEHHVALLAERRGWRRLIAVTGARIMSAWLQRWELSRSFCRLEAL